MNPAFARGIILNTRNRTWASSNTRCNTYHTAHGILHDFLRVGPVGHYKDFKVQLVGKASSRMRGQQTLHVSVAAWKYGCFCVTATASDFHIIIFNNENDNHVHVGLSTCKEQKYTARLVVDVTGSKDRT